MARGPGVALGASAPELSVPGFVGLLKNEDLKTGLFAAQMSQLQLDYKHLTDDEHDAFYDMNDERLMAEFAGAIIKRINMMNDDDDSNVSEQTRAVQSILRIMPYSGVRDALAKHLVHSPYPSALVVVMVDVLKQPDTEHDVEMQELLILIFQSMGDLCSSQWKEPGQRKPVTGRDVLGPVFMEPLLGHICLTRDLPTGVRRAATDTLLKLIVKSCKNQADLLAYDQLCDFLFNKFLATCGDYNAQLDIMEILYRAAKSGHACAVDRFIKNAQVRDLLKKMLAKQGVKVDLAQELRPVLLAFNSSLPRPTVSSFKAISISFDLPRIVPASDWVDVGSTQLMFHVKIDDLQGNSLEEIMEEPLDFHFGKMKRALVVDDEEHADAVVIDMELSELPRELIGVSTQLTTQTRDAGLRATVRAHKDMAVPLLKHLPRNQLRIESQAEELCDLSQPRRHPRIAMGMHVYREEPDQPSFTAQPSVAPSVHAHPSLDAPPHTPPDPESIHAREEAQLKRQQQREQKLKETQVMPGLGADSDLEARSEEEQQEAAAAAAAAVGAKTGAGVQEEKRGAAGQDGVLRALTDSQAEEAALQGIEDMMRDADGRVAPAPAAPAAPATKGKATRSKTQSQQREELQQQQQQQQRAASQANVGKGRKAGSQQKQPSRPLRQSPRHKSQAQLESQKQHAQEQEQQRGVQEQQQQKQETQVQERGQQEKERKAQKREQQKQEEQAQEQEQQQRGKKAQEWEQQEQEKQRRRQEQQGQKRVQKQHEEEEKEEKRAQEHNRSLRAPEDEEKEAEEPISHRTRHAESSAQKKANQAKAVQGADGRMGAEEPHVPFQDGGGGKAANTALMEDEDPAWLREGPVKAAAGAAPAPSSTHVTNQSASLLAKGITPGTHKTFAGRSRREQTSVERVSPASVLGAEEPAGAVGVRKMVLPSPVTAPRAAAAAATPARGASRFAALATPTPGGGSTRKDTTARGAAAVSTPAAAGTGAQPPGMEAAAAAVEAGTKPPTGTKAKAPTTAAAATTTAAGRGTAGSKVAAALLPNGGIGKPPKPRTGRTPKAAARKPPTPPRSVLYSEEPIRSGGRKKSGGVGKKSGGAGRRVGAAGWGGAGRAHVSQSMSADAIEDPDLSMRDMLPPTQMQQQATPAQPSAAAGLAAAAIAGARIGAVAEEAAGVTPGFDFGGGDLRAGSSEEEEEEGPRQAVPERGAKKAAAQQEPAPAAAAAARRPRAASSKARQAIRAQVESPRAARAQAPPPQGPTTQQPDRTTQQPGRRLPQPQASKPKAVPPKPVQPTPAPPAPAPETVAQAAEFAAIDGEAMVEEEEDLQINEVHAAGYDAVDVHLHVRCSEQHKPAVAAAGLTLPEPLTGTAQPQQPQRFGDARGDLGMGAATTPPIAEGTSTGLRKLPRLLNFDVLGDEQDRAAAGLGMGGLGAESAGGGSGMDEEEDLEGNGGHFQGIGGGTMHLEEALPGLGGGKRRQQLQKQPPPQQARTTAVATARPAAGPEGAGAAAAGGLGRFPKLPTTTPFGGFDLAGAGAGAPSTTPSPFEPQTYATTESPPEVSGLAAPSHLAPLPHLDLRLPGLGGSVGLGLGARGGKLGPTRGAAKARAAPAAPAAPAKRKAGTGRKGGAVRDSPQLFAPQILSPESQEGEDTGTEGILMAQLMRMLGAPGEEDEEEREEGDEEIEAIKVLMTRMMESRRLAKRQKQTHLLSEAQERVAVGAQELEAAVQKEMRDHASLVRSTVGGLSAQMDQKFKAIQALQEHFVTQLATAWEEYEGIYYQLDAAQQEMDALTNKRRAAAKRRVSSFDSSAASLLEEVAEKLEKMGKSKQLPKGLTNALQALL